MNVIIKNIKELPDRLHGIKKLLEGMGTSVKMLYKMINQLKYFDPDSIKIIDPPV